MLPFQDAARTPEGDWRHIVRFGRNVASYKFALGQALLDLGARQHTFVRLEDLAVPYAAALCEHLQVEDRQSTSAQSQFLDACRSRNRGELDAAQLAEATVRLGFANVIDAFHISRGGQPTETRFFVDERASRQGIALTDHLLELANGQQAAVLPREVDARWNLVQMSWGLRLGPGWCRSRWPRMRTPLTCTRRSAAPRPHHRCPGRTERLPGRPLRLLPEPVHRHRNQPGGRRSRAPVRAHVWRMEDGDLHQVWNLVLACYACNSAKRDRPPAADWMPWLERRAEHFIASHHPLRETLIGQLGPDRDSGVKRWPGVTPRQPT